MTCLLWVVHGVRRATNALEKFSKPIIKNGQRRPSCSYLLTLPTGLIAAYLSWKADASSTGGLMLLGASIDVYLNDLGRLGCNQANEQKK